MKCMPCHDTEPQFQQAAYRMCRWDEKTYKYKIVEPIKPPGEVDELDKYVFVVRGRIG